MAATEAASTTKGGKGVKKDLGSTGPQPRSSSSVASDMNIDMEAEDEEGVLQSKSICSISKRMWRVF